jgi:membrane-bound lytic murein transglycosylase B
MMLMTSQLPVRRRHWARAAMAAASALLLVSGSMGLAQDGGDPFAAYVQSLWPKARDQGVSRATFDAMASGLSFNARVIALDRENLSGGATADNPIPPFAPYRARHVDAARIDGGRRTYARLAPLLDRIERDTGVPARIMIAIYGHETAYGKVTGTFDLPQALATLAFDGRRRSLFEPELIATMQMVERGVPRGVLRGSWAGAFGYPQFLPSVYLRVARDGDGDGRAQIWSSEADAIASIGWYLHQAGWRRGQPWGVAVRVPADLDRTALASRLQPARCPRVFARHTRWRSIGEWRRAGVTSESGNWPADTVQATLLEPDGPGRTAYLLTGNYRAILDYNCSNFYALSVGLLADEIKN